MKLKKYSLDENITKEDYNMIKFPYYKYLVSFNDILTNMKKLMNYEAVLLNEQSIRNIFGSQNIQSINNMKIIWVTDYYKENELVFITDYFSQKCRIRCTHMNNISPIDFFSKNKEKIYNDIIKSYGRVSFKFLDIYLYKNIKQCTNFYTPIVLNVLNYFKPNSWLDFSAGWGDRLIGAIAYWMKNKDFRYTGVDPSNCMMKRYKRIIRKLTNNSTNFTIINQPFEDTNITQTFDLVFTSPPFFDLEIYENNEGQSFNRYNTIEKWFNEFMKTAINRSIELLNKDGHLALYIGESMNDKYVDITHNYISNLPNVKYIGNLHWFNKTSSKRLRTIRVWKKM